MSSTDVNGKLWPKGGRRREPVPSGAIPTKNNESSRKPIPQRNRALDKRPKPRGVYSGLYCGNQSARLEELGVEFGSVFSQGSKKQTLNHLLNFHYEPRDVADNGWHSGNKGAGSGKGKRWLNSTVKHKYNKEQYLQAK